jgi:hypothetical protein
MTLRAHRRDAPTRYVILLMALIALTLVLLVGANWSGQHGPSLPLPAIGLQQVS